jgi:hypothetical protein
MHLSWQGGGFAVAIAVLALIVLLGISIREYVSRRTRLK